MTIEVSTVYSSKGFVGVVVGEEWDMCVHSCAVVRSELSFLEFTVHIMVCVVPGNVFLYKQIFNLAATSATVQCQCWNVSEALCLLQIARVLMLCNII